MDLIEVFHERPLEFRQFVLGRPLVRALKEPRRAREFRPDHESLLLVRKAAFEHLLADAFIAAQTVRFPFVQRLFLPTR